MDKIVIINRQQESDNGFTQLLNRIFPDCEIHMVFSTTATSKEDLTRSSSAPCMIDTIMDGQWHTF